jgi:hypothetical protein
MTIVFRRPPEEGATPNMEYDLYIQKEQMRMMQEYQRMYPLYDPNTDTLHAGVRVQPVEAKKTDDHLLVLLCEE